MKAHDCRESEDGFGDNPAAPAHKAARTPPPPGLHVNCGRVVVLTPERPDAAVSITDTEACRRLLAFPVLLNACVVAFNLLDGAACPIDDPEEWRRCVLANLRAALDKAKEVRP